MAAQDPVATFRQEAEDLLVSLEQALLDLGGRPEDGELVDLAFRSLHTLKGSGAMFGFRRVASFLHAFESAFDAVRAGRSRLNPDMLAAALNAKDHVASLIREGETEVDDAAGEAILAAFAAAVGSAGRAGPAAAGPAPKAAPQGGGVGWRVTFRLPRLSLDNGANPLLMIAELAELGPCAVSGDADGPVSDLSAVPRERFGQAWTVELTSDCARAAVEEAFVFVADEADLSIAPLEAEASEQAQAPEDEPAAIEAAAPRAARPGRTAAAPAAATMRVATDRLDTIMDHVGELVIAQARLSQLARSSDDPNLKSLSEDIERLSASLRDTTMGIRMVAVGALFGRFRRLVHDLSTELGKPLELITAGEETELDKTVIEQLADPLVHLIRNAADHGLEDAATRMAAGKPAAGSLRLSAAHAGAEVVITLADDGAGFDTARIRARAEKLGMIQPEEAVAEADVWRLVFQPGFSTRSEVTELSGRGVGMDVVKRTIESLRGAIELASSPGRGASVTLRLPLTLAIIEGLLVRVGAERYVIPLAAVEECVELSAHVDPATGGRRFINIRGKLLPYLTLRELFDEPGAPDPHQKIVVVSSGEGRVGLVVDQVIGTNQTVIKQLSRLHSGIKIFSGGTILGDGAAALILDVMHVVAFGQELEGRLVAERAGWAA
jgi:two-component system chemotaxis sensor kinase CheA